MFDSYANGKRDLIMEQIHTHPMTAIFRVVLNHWQIVRRTTNFVKPFVNDLEPNIILKGDSHHVCKDQDLFLCTVSYSLLLVFYNNV